MKYIITVLVLFSKNNYGNTIGLYHSVITLGIAAPDVHMVYVGLLRVTPFVSSTHIVVYEHTLQSCDLEYIEHDWLTDNYCSM